MAQLHIPHALLETGWRRDVLITVEGRNIKAVAADTAPPPGAERLAGIAVPGMANVHSHAFQRAMAGLVERRGPEDDSFWTWREVMYRFLARMTPDDVEAVAAWLHVEMLEAGFTASGEFHYLHNDPAGARYADPAEMGARIAAAAQASGIGLALLPCFYAHGGCRRTPRQARPGPLPVATSTATGACSRRAHGMSPPYPGAVLGIAPHSLRAVDAGELRALVEGWPAGPSTSTPPSRPPRWTNASPGPAQRPVQWLTRPMPLDERWCLIHCTHMTPRGDRRACPIPAPWPGCAPSPKPTSATASSRRRAFLEAGGRFGIGSDSNVRIALGEELRTLEYGQRLRERKRNRLGPAGASTGRYLFDAARRGGAQALGLASGGHRAGLHGRHRHPRRRPSRACWPHRRCGARFVGVRRG